MTRFAIIPIIALLLYLFMFLTLLVTKKNSVIISFIELILELISWTAGSFFMRCNTFPSYEFWFHFSLIGILLFIPTFFEFVRKYLGIQEEYGNQYWIIFFVGLWAINCFYPLFIKAPLIVNGQFVYEFLWPILLIFLIYFVMIVRFVLFIHRIKQDFILKKLRPIFVGICFLVIGHLCFLIPWFNGFPIDVLSGVPMAICFFYALYKMKLFQLHLLISRINCYYFAMIIVAAVFYHLIPTLKILFLKQFDLDDIQTTMAIAYIAMITVIIVYITLHVFFDAVFGQDELTQSQVVREFSQKAAPLIHTCDIINELEKSLKIGIQTDDVYIFLKSDYLFELQKEGMTYQVYIDDKIIDFLKSQNHCTSIHDFQMSKCYYTLNDELKSYIERWNIKAIALMNEGNQQLGLIAVGEKENKKRYHLEDINFLKSISSVASIALINAQLYEEAYDEARKDYLTGVANRRRLFEVLDMCQKNGVYEYGTFMMVSVDDFKLYNQLYGDEKGDIALYNIAQILHKAVKDIGLVARYSGKVFAIILPEKTTKDAYMIAKQFKEEIMQLNQKDGKYPMKVLTVSCGIASGSCIHDGFEKVMRHADEALYYAKQVGKNRIECYSEGTKNASFSQTKGMPETYTSTVYALMAAIDTKDHYTFSHSENVAYYSQELAKAYGLNDEAVKMVYEAGLLHDIGKIGIDEKILNKPGKLTEEEYEQMKKHVELSIGIIRHLPSLDYVIPAVIGHHERYDGKGYPRGIAGESIPLMARILTITDSFDAMTSKRSYKSEMSVEKAIEILRSESYHQFDGKLVECFIQLIENGQLQIKAKNNAIVND